MCRKFLFFDRSLLGVYVVGVFALMAMPFSEPEFSLLGVESDKWFHIVIFFGLSVLLRWNLQEKRLAWVWSFGIACAVALAVEVVQSVLPYRDAEIMDLIAGMVGSFVGSTTAVLIIKSKQPNKALGGVTICMGIVIAVMALSADLLGIGADRNIGRDQIWGAIFGILVMAAGSSVYLKKPAIGTHDSKPR